MSNFKRVKGFVSSFINAPNEGTVVDNSVSFIYKSLFVLYNVITLYLIAALFNCKSFTC